jgi:hypothetical protein
MQPGHLKRRSTKRIDKMTANVRTPEVKTSARKPEIETVHVAQPARVATAAMEDKPAALPAATKPDWKKFSENLFYKVDGSMIEFRVDTARTLKESASGKSYLIASTAGCVPLPDGGLEDVMFNINIFSPK